jgi:hypothetical protein
MVTTSTQAAAATAELKSNIGHDWTLADATREDNSEFKGDRSTAGGGRPFVVWPFSCRQWILVTFGCDGENFLPDPVFKLILTHVFKNCRANK